MPPSLGPLLPIRSQVTPYFSLPPCHPRKTCMFPGGSYGILIYALTMHETCTDKTNSTSCVNREVLDQNIDCIFMFRFYDSIFFLIYAVQLFFFMFIDHIALRSRGIMYTVVFICLSKMFVCNTLSEAIGSLSHRRNSSDGSVLIRRLTEV